MLRRIVLIVAGILLVAGCMSGGERPVGVLEGKVTISPLCAHEPCQMTQDDVAKAYASRKVYVSSREMDTFELNLSSDGRYRVELPPGKYMVDIDHTLKGKSYEVPARIDIEVNKTKELNINIDTGLRGS